MGENARNGLISTFLLFWAFFSFCSGTHAACMVNTITRASGEHGGHERTCAAACRRHAGYYPRKYMTFYFLLISGYFLRFFDVLKSAVEKCLHFSALLFLPACIGALRKEAF